MRKKRRRNGLGAGSFRPCPSGADSLIRLGGASHEPAWLHGSSPCLTGMLCDALEVSLGKSYSTGSQHRLQHMPQMLLSRRSTKNHFSFPTLPLTEKPATSKRQKINNHYSSGFQFIVNMSTLTIVTVPSSSTNCLDAYLWRVKISHICQSVFHLLSNLQLNQLLHIHFQP